MKKTIIAKENLFSTEESGYTRKCEDLKWEGRGMKC